MRKKVIVKTPKQTVQLAYPCSECGGDAYIAYTANGDSSWDGKVKSGERICLPCGRKRGVNFFNARN